MRKKIKLNDIRAEMEKVVEERNEMFNSKNELRTMSYTKLNAVSLETINVNSLVDMGRISRMKALLKQWNNDITVMVDTRIPANKAGLFRTKEWAIMSTNKSFRGVVIQINKRLDPELIEVDEENANYLAVAFDMNGKKIGLLGVYAPNNDDPKFFREAINRVLAKLALKTDDLIIAGDFNVNLAYSIGYSTNRSYKKEALEENMKVWNLKDIVDFSAKKCGVEPLTYIHTTKNQGPDKDIYPLKAARLDTVLTTMDLSSTKVEIGRFYPSDHASVRISFQEAKESGKKIWKMNVKLLEEELLIRKWRNAAANLTVANNTLETRLEEMRNLSEHRKIELLGKDAFRRWGDLLGIVKASAIEFTRDKDKANKERNESLLSGEEIKNLEKEELEDILDEIGKQESDKIRIKTELKNYKMNATNKKLTKHKMRMEEQLRRIRKITINGKTLTNADKIKEGIQRYYKFQFRCQCKNKTVPNPCTICKSNPVHYAKAAAKNFKKRTYKQK